MVTHPIYHVDESLCVALSEAVYYINRPPV